MDLIFSYFNLEKLENKNIVCFGCLKSSREFALRLIGQDICFDYFLFPENNMYYLPHLMNKPVLNIEKLKALSDYVVLVSWKELSYARKVLYNAGLEQNLLEIERIQPKLTDASNLIIYGTGGRAKRLFNDINKYLDIYGFCDSNKDKSGSCLNDKPIIHASELSNFSKNTCIIIGSTYYDEIKNTLLRYGIDEENIFYVEYDLTIFPYDQHKISYNLTCLLELINDCKDKKVILYGEKRTVQIMSKKFSYLGLNVREIIERDSLKEDGTIYSLVYYNIQNTICIIVDMYSKITHNALKEIGLEETQYAWVDNYSSYYVSGKETAYQCVLDPHLGHTYIHEDVEHPGFIEYKNVSSEGESPIVILTLGGSTTSGYGVRQKPWSLYLSEILTINNINHVIYCGGMDSYTASQELIKLIRDGIWLKPDFVISYSGMNNMSITSKTPFVSYYQKEFYDSISEFAVLPYLGTMRGVNYGIESCCDNYEYWYMQIKMMYAICNTLGIEYKAFLQPVLYNKKNINDSDIDVAILEGFMLDISNKSLVAVEATEKCIMLQKNAVYFRKMAESITEPWFYDLSDLFDNESRIYMDYCHVYEKGNKIIAKKIFEIIKYDIKNL